MNQTVLAHPNTSLPHQKINSVRIKDELSATLKDLEGGVRNRVVTSLIRSNSGGQRATARILAAEGGVCSATEAAKRLKISLADLELRRQSRRVVAIGLDDYFVYPLWQFEPAVAANLESVLSALPPQINGLALQIFFLEPTSYCDDMRPIDALRKLKVDLVLRVASIYGEQGAA